MNREFERENELEYERRSRGRSRRKGAPEASGGPEGARTMASEVSSQRAARFTSHYQGARASHTEETERPLHGASRRLGAGGGESGKKTSSQEGWIDLDEPRGGSGPSSGRPGPRVGGQKGKKEEDPQKKAKKRLRRIIITLVAAEFLALCLIFSCRYVVQKMNLIGRNTGFNMADMTNPNLSHEKLETMQGYWTVALFGVDSRGDNVARQTNSDVIIIANVNMDTGEIKLVSVYRDSYLNIDEGNSYNKINQAYFLGGAEQAISALNRNLDLQIDDYGTFNWKTVAQAINILGGVDVNLSKAEFYYINAYITETVKATGIGSTQLTHAGENHLDGIQAVAYARLRNMDTDFARTERQREVIGQAFEKMKKADFATINNVMETVLKGIETNISYDDLLPAAMNLTKYHISETTGFPTAREDANMGKKGACVIPATLESNVKILHEFLFGEEDYEPSDKVKQISAKISADSGKYKEAAPIGSVGTDGGYIPSPTTTAAEREDEETTVSDETTGTEETTGLHPSIGDDWIDGEYLDGLELETDEDGNYIDPPEGYGPGYEYTRPAPTRESESPGHGTVAHPTDAPTRSDDALTGPGVPTTAPTTAPAVPTGASTEAQSPANPTTSAAVTPATRPEVVQDNTSGGPGSVILTP